MIYPNFFMENRSIIPKGIAWPFALLTILFFAWAVPNNLTDTMLAAFKRIMSLSDSKTAWIQVVCYLLGYGCFAIPGALFIKRYTYKSGVMLGLGLYALGTFMFYPAMLVSAWSAEVGFVMFLLAIFVLFAGLSILETSPNLTPSEPHTMVASERAALPEEELVRIQGAELNAVTMTYMALGAVMVAILLAIRFTRMPRLKEGGALDFRGSLGRLLRNRNYVWGVVGKFFYVGAQIAVWSFVIRYAMQQLRFDEVVASLGADAAPERIIEALRHVEPVAAGFYAVCESIGLDALLPRTPEQASATYYILSLILFVAARFVCTYLMKFFKPRNLLTAVGVLAVLCCLGTIYGHGRFGVYALMGISGCMSLMFPTIYGMGFRGRGEDTKLGGSGMVMAIAGAALLTQIQGIVSDQAGSIAQAYWVPAIAFAVVVFYSSVICRKYE